MDSIQTAEGTRSKDPVCGMMVDPAAARGGSHAHNGKTYFFCNPRCRERFAADPEKYLDPAYRPGGMGGMVQLGGIAPQQTQPQLAAEGTRSKDPVCGMMVDPAAARGGSHAHKGKHVFLLQSALSRTVCGRSGEVPGPGLQAGRNGRHGATGRKHTPADKTAASAGNRDRPRVRAGSFHRGNPAGKTG